MTPNGLISSEDLSASGGSALTRLPQGKEDSEDTDPHQGALIMHDVISFAICVVSGEDRTVSAGILPSSGVDQPLVGHRRHLLMLLVEGKHVRLGGEN